MALKIRVRSLLTLLTILGLALQHRGLTCSYEELKLDTCPYQYGTQPSALYPLIIFPPPLPMSRPQYKADALSSATHR